MSSKGLSRRISKALTGPVLLIALVAWSSPAPAQTAAEQAKNQAKKTGNAVSDGWITMKVHSQFVPEDALEGSDIDVDTNRGVVTLTGTVPTEAGRNRAVAIAKATDGVASVNDKLKIAPAAAATTAARDAGRAAGDQAKDAAGKTRETAGTAGRAVTDGWITSKIYSQYLVEDALDDSDIDLDVEKGVVTINGTVTSDAGRSRAAAIAKATDGVKNVKNNLKISAKKEDK